MQAVGVLALMCTLQWRLTVVTFMAVPLIIAASQVATQPLNPSSLKGCTQPHDKSATYIDHTSCE